ncbi:MAG: hypothetical protein L0H31_02395 [Nocardioidaceae bacterium]|nr:hypothetical protein [Nocardioidaceae bacterium]
MVVIDDRIAPGTPDKITGGVVVVSGATVDKVEIAGAVTTHARTAATIPGDPHDTSKLDCAAACCLMSIPPARL